MAERPVVIALPGFERLAPRWRPADPPALTVGRFANGELHVTLTEDVAARRCALVGSVAPPERQLVEFLLAADTLRRHGAAQLTAVLPYLGYARQDRPEAGASLAGEWIGSLLRGAGVTDVLTIDIHSDAAAQLLGLPVVPLSPAALFAAAIGRLEPEQAVAVAPDAGARARARAFAAAAGLAGEVVWLEKRRSPGGVSHIGLQGELRPHAVVVDDILDTGGTLVSCCRELRDRGVRRITVVVTHGLFTGIAWRELLTLEVEAVHTTDTVARALFQMARAVQVHPAAGLLEEAFG